MNSRNYALFLGLLLAVPICNAQPDFLRDARPVSPAPPDPAVAQALKTIDPKSIESTIKALVQFGTRTR